MVAQCVYTDEGFTKGGRVSGDQGFEAFAVARTPALYRSAWLLCGDKHTAEDLVQETLAKVYVAWHKRRPIDNPPAYAHTTLVRTFISAKRRRSSTERPTEVLPEKGQHDPDVALRESLLAALAQLPQTDRAVLVLRFLDDQSIEQVAQHLDISAGAVRSRTLRALTRIRGVLGTDFEALIHGGPR